MFCHFVVFYVIIIYGVKSLKCSSFECKSYIVNIVSCKKRPISDTTMTICHSEHKRSVHIADKSGPNLIF